MRRLALLLLTASACHNHTVATPQDCEAIVERLVALEMAERGYQDPVLQQRRTREIFSTHANLMAECPGKALPHHARDCLAKATNPHTVIRDCLGLPDH